MSDLEKLRRVLRDRDSLTQLCAIALQKLPENIEPSKACYRFGQSMIESYNIVEPDVIDRLTKAYHQRFTKAVLPNTLSSFECVLEFLQEILSVVESFLSQPKSLPAWQYRGPQKQAPYNGNIGIPSKSSKDNLKEVSSSINDEELSVLGPLRDFSNRPQSRSSSSYAPQLHERVNPQPSPEVHGSSINTVTPSVSPTRGTRTVETIAPFSCPTTYREHTHRSVETIPLPYQEIPTSSMGALEHERTHLKQEQSRQAAAQTLLSPQVPVVAAAVVAAATQAMQPTEKKKQSTLWNRVDCKVKRLQLHPLQSPSVAPSPSVPPRQLASARASSLIPTWNNNQRSASMSPPRIGSKVMLPHSTSTSALAPTPWRASISPARIEPVVLPHSTSMSALGPTPGRAIGSSERSPMPNRLGGYRSPNPMLRLFQPPPRVTSKLEEPSLASPWQGVRGNLGQMMPRGNFNPGMIRGQSASPEIPQPQQIQPHLSKGNPHTTSVPSLPSHGLQPNPSGTTLPIACSPLENSPGSRAAYPGLHYPYDTTLLADIPTLGHSPSQITTLYSPGMRTANPGQSPTITNRSNPDFTKNIHSPPSRPSGTIGSPGHSNRASSPSRMQMTVMPVASTATLMLYPPMNADGSIQSISGTSSPLRSHVYRENNILQISQGNSASNWLDESHASETKEERIERMKQEVLSSVEKSLKIEEAAAAAMMNDPWAGHLLSAKSSNTPSRDRNGRSPRAKHERSSSGSPGRQIKNRRSPSGSRTLQVGNEGEGVSNTSSGMPSLTSGGSESVSGLAEVALKKIGKNNNIPESKSPGNGSPARRNSESPTNRDIRQLRKPSNRPPANQTSRIPQPKNPRAKATNNRCRHITHQEKEPMTHTTRMDTVPERKATMRQQMGRR